MYDATRGSWLLASLLGALETSWASGPGMDNKIRGLLGPVPTKSERNTSWSSFHVQPHRSWYNTHIYIQYIFISMCTHTHYLYYICCCSVLDFVWSFLPLSSSYSLLVFKSLSFWDWDCRYQTWGFWPIGHDFGLVVMYLHTFSHIVYLQLSM